MSLPPDGKTDGKVRVHSELGLFVIRFSPFFFLFFLLLSNFVQFRNFEKSSFFLPTVFPYSYFKLYFPPILPASSACCRDKGQKERRAKIEKWIEEEIHTRFRTALGLDNTSIPWRVDLSQHYVLVVVCRVSSTLSSCCSPHDMF